MTQEPKHKMKCVFIMAWSNLFLYQEIHPYISGLNAFLATYICRRSNFDP